MKKLFLSSLLLALPLLASAYDAEVDGIYYNLNSEEKTAEVTYQSKDLYDNITSVYTGSVDIPEEFVYEGVEYTVTSIGYSAFYYCSNLTSVTIPNTVVSVADNAFYGCNGLPIEDGIRYAGTVLIGVVDKTQSSYSIKEGTRFILSNAFNDCRSLTSITIPNSVIIIGNNAFSNCRYLKSIEIGNSVTSIGENAFYYCLSLTSLTIPNSVTSIGLNAFEGCSQIENLTLDCSEIGSWFQSLLSLKSITLGNSVIKIQNEAFRNCRNLTTVSIGNSVTTIGLAAFLGCSSLTSITLPNSLTSIEGDYSWLGGAFENCSGLISIVIPNSVTRIGQIAFRGCTSLTSVTIGNSVSSIGDYAFSGCSNLSSVYITDLGAWCKIDFENNVNPSGWANPLLYAHHLFLNGEEVKDLVIPNSVTSISDEAFAGCYNITSVTIPNSVTYIGGRAFSSNDIEKVICYAENVPMASLDAFSNYQTATLYVPSQSLSKYKTSSPWCNFKYINAIEDGEPTKCATPSISYANKQLTYSCETEGVEYHYSITDSDIKSGIAGNIDLSATYEISVYATKSGYYDSDVATATLVWTDAIFTETTETPTSAKVVTESIPVLISANGGVITVKSEQEGQAVAVYTADGKALGSSTVKDGQATVATNLQRGEIVIVKVGGRSVKVKMSDF